MSEPITIYDCPCGARGFAPIEHRRGCEEPPHPVRVFREEDVRPLWLALVTCHDADVLGLAEAQALDAFPAPEEWR